MSRENEVSDADDHLVYAYWKIFSTGGCYRQKFNKRMAETEVQKCLDWLLDQKTEFEQARFGQNKSAVGEARQAHTRNTSKLIEYRKHLDSVQSKHKLTDEELYALCGTYQSVQTLSEKRTDCFQVMSGITTLEDQIQSLSTEFDTKSIHLVNSLANNKPKNPAHLSNESMAKTTQNCITAVRQSWKWLDEVMQCAHVHLANAAAYHEFFHEVEEIDYWLNATMSTLHLTFSRQRLNGDRSDLTDINDEMKDTLLAYLRWQSKVDSVFTRARDIVPVHKRTTPVSEPCPVIALTNYETNEIQFKEGETLTLLNNTDKASWRVKNARDQVGTVPAVILLLNGPTGNAVDAAVRLRLQLLGLWTTSVKRLGFKMIAFMQLVFKDWNDEEIRSIQSMSRADREDLTRVLKKIEGTLQKNWQGYEGFEDLQEKISRLRTILEEADNRKPPPETSKEGGEVVIQIKLLEGLLNNYQEFWTYWETYKVVVELIRQPKYILVCDNWEQMRYTATAHFVKFWDTNLQMGIEPGGAKFRAEAALTLHETPKTKLSPDDEKISREEVEDVMMSQTDAGTDSTMDDALATMNGSEEMWSSSDVTEVRRRQQMTTDEVVQSTTEVRHTFVIKSVYDPRIQEEISLTEAVYAGIIDQAAGRYVNVLTGESTSFQEAMGNGDITVEFKSQRKIREERSSYGIITIKTSKETRPYTIIAVLDPKTEEELPTEAAYKKGILNRDTMAYTTEKGEVLSILDAIHSGLVRAEFHGHEEDNEDETKTYAVNGVVDQRKKDKVSFSEALNTGLLDAEEGVYVNNVTWERVPMTEAIMRGFIKARIITDTSKLNIDPTNKIVVEKLNTARDKILNAVKITKAFKSSATTNGAH